MLLLLLLIMMAMMIWGRQNETPQRGGGGWHQQSRGVVIKRVIDGKRHVITSQEQWVIMCPQRRSQLAHSISSKRGAGQREYVKFKVR